MVALLVIFTLAPASLLFRVCFHLLLLIFSAFFSIGSSSSVSSVNAGQVKVSVKASSVTVEDVRAVSN